MPKKQTEILEPHVAEAALGTAAPILPALLDPSISPIA